VTHDRRTPLERTAWRVIGPPLYYCAECLLRVSVVVRPDSAPLITRDQRCTHDGQIIAPRRAILVGRGSVSLATRMKIRARQAAARATGRDA
jgi:hypothetical protein